MVQQLSISCRRFAPLPTCTESGNATAQAPHSFDCEARVPIQPATREKNSRSGWGQSEIKISLSVNSAGGMRRRSEIAHAATGSHNFYSGATTQRACHSTFAHPATFHPTASARNPRILLSCRRRGCHEVFRHERAAEAEPVHDRSQRNLFRGLSQSGLRYRGLFFLA